MESYYLSLVQSMRFQMDDAEDKIFELNSQLEITVQENIEIRLQNENLKEELKCKDEEIKEYQSFIEMSKVSVNEAYSDKSVECVKVAYDSNADMIEVLSAEIRDLKHKLQLLDN
jgi:regulator of replication initiation timing